MPTWVRLNACSSCPWVWIRLWWGSVLRKLGRKQYRSDWAKRFSRVEVTSSGSKEWQQLPLVTFLQYCKVQSQSNPYRIVTKISVLQKRMDITYDNNQLISSLFFNERFWGRWVCTFTTGRGRGIQIKADRTNIPPTCGLRSHSKECTDAGDFQLIFALVFFPLSK